jgi:hypothetical protein
VGYYCSRGPHVCSLVAIATACSFPLERRAQLTRESTVDTRAVRFSPAAFVVGFTRSSGSHSVSTCCQVKLDLSHAGLHGVTLRGCR